jgi:hypothetical protein
MMVVVNMDFNILTVSEFCELPDPAFLPGVHKDQAFDPIKVHMLELRKVKEVGRGVEKKIPKVLFLGPGKHQCGRGIEFPGCNHGSQSIEIGIHVSRDDLFTHVLRGRVLQIFFRPMACHGSIIT